MITSDCSGCERNYAAQGRTFRRRNSDHTSLDVWTDVRTTRHLHGRTERGARCATVKVPAESADAVARYFNCTLGTLDLKRRRLLGDPPNLLVLLVYLQGAAVIFRLGRHHHRGPFCEGQGLTHALTDTAPTDLTVATHSPLGAQP